MLCCNVPFDLPDKNFRTQGVVVEPKVEDWDDDVGMAIGLIFRVDLVDDVTVSVVVRTVEPDLPILLPVIFGFWSEVALVVLGKTVGVDAAVVVFGFIPLFLLFIMVEILWE